jgi:hypothetical protein
MNPGPALKSIGAGIAFPASNAVTIAAGCVAVLDHAAAASRPKKHSGERQGKSIIL